MTGNHKHSAGPSVRLDETDRQLLALLRRNARMPLVGLARAVSLSRSAVQGRLQKLERCGAIGGYTIRGRTSGKPAQRAVITLTLSARPCRLVLDRLRGWPEIESCYSVAGDTDAILFAGVADAASLSRLIDRLAALRGVTQVRSHPILDTVLEPVTPAKPRISR